MWATLQKNAWEWLQNCKVILTRLWWGQRPKKKNTRECILLQILTDSFFQIIRSVKESFWGKLDLPWLLTLDFVCLLFYLQYRPVQTEAPATRAANIGGLNFSCPFEKAEMQIPVNNYEWPQRLSFSLGNLFWGSFTNHNTGNYLDHGINITTNQRLSPTFRGNGNTIIVGDSQTSPLPIFPEGGGTSVHRLQYSSSTVMCPWAGQRVVDRNPLQECEGWI